MSLELLANELLFDLFDYLSCVDLFHSFNGLNIRFDQLLIEYFQIKKSFDFRLILKEDLNLIRRRYLSLFIDNIESIILSDNDETPHEIDIFLSRLYPLNRFINLKSITLNNIYSIQKMIRILDDLKQISTLTNLKFSQCYIQYDPKNLIIIMNSIWSLSNLISCYLDLSFKSNSYLIIPTIISCSIQYLTIRGFQCGIENLQLLSEQTPYLKSLSIDTIEHLDNSQPLSLINSLITFKFQCEISSILIQSLLRIMPNLINLTIEIKHFQMDGNIWQNIIQRYLTNLKIFNLKMKFQINDNNHIETIIDNLINTYQTDFWIKQHKWFIRCFSSIENDENIIYLHTYPYQFQYFNIHINEIEYFIFKSTYPDDINYLEYKSVKNLDYSLNISNEINIFKFKFPTIKYLTLTLPHDNFLQYIIPQFDNLIYLQIQIIGLIHYNNHELIQLQTLLDHAPRLYYLKFHLSSSTISKNEYKNKKVNYFI